MKKEEKYEKLIRLLKVNEPELTDREGLTENIMKKISDGVPDSGSSLQWHEILFSWTARPWMRVSLAAVTLVFIFIFSFQQAFINHRIKTLEDQVVSIGNKPAEENLQGVSTRLLIKFLEREKSADSITVSADDLENLLNSYFELNKTYEDLKNSAKENKLKHHRERDEQQKQPGNENPAKNI